MPGGGDRFGRPSRAACAARCQRQRSRRDRETTSNHSVLVPSERVRRTRVAPTIRRIQPFGHAALPTFARSRVEALAARFSERRVAGASQKGCRAWGEVGQARLQRRWEARVGGAGCLDGGLSRAAAEPGAGTSPHRSAEVGQISESASRGPSPQTGELLKGRQPSRFKRPFSVPDYLLIWNKRIRSASMVSENKQ